MSKMKAIVIPEPGRVEIREVEKPALTPGHAIVKLLYGGICGSDMGTYKGTFLYAKYPRIPGHEFSGEIVEVGENDRGLKPGMVVTANPYFNCGSCYSCERGNVNCCEANETMGAQRDGAFSEYISMPVERIYDGKGLGAEALSLIEPFCISYHAAKRGRVKQGDKVLVIGAGTIGYLAALASVMLGADVTVADIAPAKLEKVAKLGCKTILNEDEKAFKAAAEEATEGKGFDVCLECVGLPSTFQNCIDAAAFRGRVVVVGVGKESLDFFYTAIQTKELDIMGSRNALKEDFLELIDLVKAGRANVLDLVSATYPMEDAQRAFADGVKHADTMLKLMIRFGEEG